MTGLEAPPQTMSCLKSSMVTRESLGAYSALWKMGGSNGRELEVTYPLADQAEHTSSEKGIEGKTLADRHKRHMKVSRYGTELGNSIDYG